MAKDLPDRLGLHAAIFDFLTETAIKEAKVKKAKPKAKRAKKLLYHSTFVVPKSDAPTVTAYGGRRDEPSRVRKVTVKGKRK